MKVADAEKGKGLARLGTWSRVKETEIWGTCSKLVTEKKKMEKQSVISRTTFFTG